VRWIGCGGIEYLFGSKAVGSKAVGSKPQEQAKVYLMYADQTVEGGLPPPTFFTQYTRHNADRL